MSTRIPIVGLALGLLAALASTAPSPVSYAYYAYAPLELRVDAGHDEASVRISEISYRSGSATIRAALVTPKHAGGSLPGVVFVHWLGEPATSNHTEFLEDAKWLARRGIVSLLPDAAWSQAQWFQSIRSTASDAADSVAAVVAIRRAFDVLLHTDGVDAKRLAFVGHDFGAMYGALFAGVDPRPRAFVFLAPATTLAQWFLLDTRRPPGDAAAYAATMHAFDIPAALQRATFGAALLQFATHDAYVSAATAQRFTDAVLAPDKTMRRYDAGHALDVTTATDERRAWLVAHLQ